MNLTLLLLPLVIALALVIIHRFGGGLAATGRRPGFKKTVIIHTRDERSIRGVLMEDCRDHLRLIQPELLATEEKATELGGEVVIPKGNVSWMQLVAE